MNTEQARRFTETWLRDWNTHDLDAILAHYSDDVVFTSPIAKTIVPRECCEGRPRRADTGRKDCAVSWTFTSSW